MENDGAGTVAASLSRQDQSLSFPRYLDGEDLFRLYIFEGWGDRARRFAIGERVLPEP